MHARQILLLAAAVLPCAVSCGDPTPVGVPVPPAAIVVRGTVVGIAGESLSPAVVESWAIVARPGGSNSDQFAGCQGQREADVTRATTDALGRFSSTVPVPSDVAVFCLAVRVQPPSGSTYLPTAIALDSLRIRIPGLPPRDTLRVQLVLETVPQ